MLFQFAVFVVAWPPALGRPIETKPSAFAERKKRNDLAKLTTARKAPVAGFTHVAGPRAFAKSVAGWSLSQLSVPSSPLAWRASS